MTTRETKTPPWQLSALGDCALQLRAEPGISPEHSQRMHAARVALQASDLDQLLAMVPAFDSLTLRFAPGHDLARAESQILAALARPEQSYGPASGRTIEIQLEAEPGPDLPLLAAQLGCSCEQALAQFCAADYLVAQLGFQPGFPYLLGLPAALAMPRRAVPRAAVQAGSVAIGGAQAGIYPSASPGGWNLLAHTTQVLFDPLAKPPCLLAPGDRVRFFKIAPSCTGRSCRHWQSPAR